MSVKHALLALLYARPSSTYQLRKRFDESTGQSVPLNIGQVSTTLQRLERDGMVVRDNDAADGGENDGTGQLWALSDEGRNELASWWLQPVIAAGRGRDELVVKLTLATVTPDVDVEALVQTQRASTQRIMHDLTRLRRDVDSEDLVGRLVLDHQIFISEAELRWLDDVEAALLRARVQRRSESDAGTSADEAPETVSRNASSPGAVQ